MRPKDQIPDQAEHNQLRAYLARRGLKPAEVDAAAGPAVAGRSRLHVAAAVTGWLKQRPKG